MRSKIIYFILCIFANNIKASVQITINRLNKGNNNNIIQYFKDNVVSRFFINKATEYIIKKFKAKLIVIPKYRSNPVGLDVLYVIFKIDATINLVSISQIIKIIKYIDIIMILRICDPSNNNIRKMHQRANVMPKFIYVGI